MLLRKGRILLPVMIALCSIEYSHAQQQANQNQGTIRNGNPSTVGTLQAIPRQKPATEYSYVEQEHPYGGTFQFVSKKGFPQQYFTTDILEFIEANRDAEVDKVIQYTETTKIIIPSKREIGRRKFQPYKTLYSFE